MSIKYTYNVPCMQPSSGSKSRKLVASRSRSGGHQVLVESAKAILARDPGSPHPLGEVATALGVSASHIAHVFRAEAGMPLHQYLLQLRMALAMARLSSGPRDLSRLALDLGFATHSHFTSAFRRAYGVAPSGVRGLFDGRGMDARR
jgi:AraC family transcriptional regulator